MSVNNIVNNYNYQCVYCEKEFKDAQALHKHTYYLHISKKRYECEYCGKYEYSKAILKQHTDSCYEALDAGHEPELFDCDLCDKSFKQKGNLSCHRVKMHKIEKPHTRITRNKIRKQILSTKFSVKENTNIKSPKRFYIIETINNIEYTERELDIENIGRINIINKYLCKAVCNLWCDNLNIIDGFNNINWDCRSNENIEKNEKIFNIWKSFNESIISLMEDRPKQKDCIETILNIICKNKNYTNTDNSQDIIS
jgi:hypothetical protein